MALYSVVAPNFPIFVPPKPDRKYSHTNSYHCAMSAITQDDHRSQLELELGGPVSLSERAENLG